MTLLDMHTQEPGRDILAHLAELHGDCRAQFEATLLTLRIALVTEAILTDCPAARDFVCWASQVPCDVLGNLLVVDRLDAWLDDECKLDALASAAIADAY